jgi:hypothetical protein
MKKESKGLGDTIAKITKATGIDKVAKFVLGEDCGCDKRKEKLNKLFPYAKPKCLTEDEFNTLDTYYKDKKETLSSEEQIELLKINNRVFTENKTPTTCASCLRDLVIKLKQIYNEYKEENLSAEEETIVK